MASDLSASVLPDAVVEPAPAKVNLYLHLVGRRHDGYHLLDSLMVFTDYGDVVSVRPAADLSLSVTGPFAHEIDQLGDQNLVLRAAADLAAAADVMGHAAITLEKRLPVAAGIGGGSADAAAALRALRRFWNLTIDDKVMRRLALKLGADVPACLVSRPVVASGIGETLDELGGDWPVLDIVLVNPLKPLGTADVFAARTGEFDARGPSLQKPGSADELISVLSIRRNDLQAPACILEPAVGEVLDSLSNQIGCRLARMSGSGATCFGLFTDAASARAAARCMTRARPDWWVIATSSR